MRKQLTAISARQTAKVIALMWLLFTLPFGLLMAVALAFSSAVHKPPLAFALLLPVLYAVFGYLFTLLGTWVYNFVAKRAGGIEFTTVEVEDAQPGASGTR
jgi:hypothetical protein